MTIPNRFRKPTHVILFIAILLIQIIIFIFWYQQNTNQKKLVEAVDNASQPNKALALSNMATKFYLEASNSFSDYLQDYDPKSLV